MKITIPKSVLFAHLNLSRLPSGEVAFDWAPIQAICEASGLDVAIFKRSHEDNVAGLLTQWYATARAEGEPIDAVAEQLFTEALSEYN